MAELKPIEVVMRIDFASSNGIEVIAHAERVCELVRCKDCKHWGSTISQADREQCALKGVDLVCNYWESDGLYSEDFCSYAERKETENEHDL